MRKFQCYPCGRFKTGYDQELSLFATDLGRFWMLLGLVILFGVIPFVSSPYGLTFVTLVGIFAIGAVGLNLLMGFAGQVSLAHGAFMGVGAYTAAILASRADLPLVMAIPAGGVMAAVAGVLLGLCCARLTPIFVCMATLAGQFLLEFVLAHWEYVTLGPAGITIPDAGLAGLDPGNGKVFFYMTFLIFVALIWIAMNLLRTGVGRALTAIRDNERAAGEMGVPVFFYKLLAFGISAFFAGFAGALYAGLVRSITPDLFSFWMSVQYVAMLIIGGLGSLLGSVLGAFFIVGLNEVLAYLAAAWPLTDPSAGNTMNIAPIQELLYGLMIVLFLLFQPKGLAQVWSRVLSRFKAWPFAD